MFLSLQLSLISIIIDEQKDPCKVYRLEDGIGALHEAVTLILGFLFPHTTTVLRGK